MERCVNELKRLVEIIDRLRGPGGCPWDREQTLPDMARHIEGEVAEAADAIARSGGAPSAAICEELGDVLMNVFLAARIAAETSEFDLAAVAAGICDKLIRRHPHVFGDAHAENVADVLQVWLAAKADEKRAGTDAADSDVGSSADGEGSSGNGDVVSVLDRVPRSLSPLALAHELARAAAKTGFDWPDAPGALRKVREEVEEVEARIDETGASGPSTELASELGDLLLATANLCRKAGVHPDEALRDAAVKFERRFRAIEPRIRDLDDPELDEMEALWQAEKMRETSGEDPAVEAGTR